MAKVTAIRGVFCVNFFVFCLSYIVSVSYFGSAFPQGVSVSCGDFGGAINFHKVSIILVSLEYNSSYIPFLWMILLFILHMVTDIQWNKLM